MREPTSIIAAVYLLRAIMLPEAVLSLDNGLARVPPKGWCSWNAYHRNFNESVFLNVAERMNSNGMKAAGYEYINVDGGWWAGSDTGTIVRNASGYFQENKDKFPGGIANLVQRIHDMGYKWGHYTDSGLHACNGDKPMSEGYEHQDARLFALEYQVDMVKVDACGATQPAQHLMETWQRELNQTGRPILFSNCHNGCESGNWNEWCGKLSNMWRSSSDIKATWQSMLRNLDTLKGRGHVVGPGKWNDPDFIEIGIGEFGKLDTLPYSSGERQQLLDMNQAHMTMWSITSSPLIAGVRPEGMTPTVVSIFTNKVAIEINEQWCCGNGGDILPIINATDKEVWHKPLSHSIAAVALFNRSPSIVSFDINLADIPGIGASFGSTCSVVNVWDGYTNNITGALKFAEVRSRQAVFLRISDCT